MYLKKLGTQDKTDKPILSKMTSIGCDNYVLCNNDGSEVGFEPPSDWKPSESKPPKKKKAIKVTKTRKPKK